MKVSKQSFQANLEPLLEHKVVMRTKELRGRTLKLATPMLPLFTSNSPPEKAPVP